MYLRCDGDLVLNPDNTASCTNWVAVPETELLATFVQQYGLSAENFAYLSAFTFLAFIVAFGFKSQRQVIMPTRED